MAAMTSHSWKYLYEPTRKQYVAKNSHNIVRTPVGWLWAGRSCRNAIHHTPVTDRHAAPTNSDPASTHANTHPYFHTVWQNPRTGR